LEWRALAAQSQQDIRYMKMALRLASRGQGRVSPNPLVGCVIVRRGRVVGQGWHRAWGEPHAEVEALRIAGAKSRGATLYVTLEPCSHQGKTPPCTGAILESGLSRVVAAMKDPNPHVRGGGAALLAARGLEVCVGALEKEARELNRGFVKWARTGMPFVTLKLALSLDGRLATRGGDSKWVTGQEARAAAHRLRARHDAVVVGAATAAIDDPALTVRHARGPNPVRIVLDGRLASPCPARWLAHDGVRRIVVTTPQATPARRAAFAATGAEVWTVPPLRTGRVDLKAFLRAAAAEGLRTLLVEGGGRIASSFLRAGLVDRLEIFFAPVLLGHDGRNWTEGLGVRRVSAAPRLKGIRVRRIGADWLVSGEM
jgi:diaminohydroxyphosphoribosylaminopyrimidine deaminase / 5-amino-6-(5-phosphoribosylamino)uracil reductase